MSTQNWFLNKFERYNSILTVSHAASLNLEKKLLLIFSSPPRARSLSLVYHRAGDLGGGDAGLTNARPSMGRIRTSLPLLARGGSPAHELWSSSVGSCSRPPARAKVSGGGCCSSSGRRLQFQPPGLGKQASAVGYGQASAPRIRLELSILNF
jgi:hypothetical protein